MPPPPPPFGEAITEARPKAQPGDVPSADTPPTVGDRTAAPRGRPAGPEPRLPTRIGMTGPAEPALPDLMAIKIDEPEHPPHRSGSSSSGGSAALPLGIGLLVVGIGLGGVALLGMIGLAVVALSGGETAEAPPPPPPLVVPAPAPEVPAAVEPTAVEPAPAPAAPVAPAPTPSPTPSPAPAPGRPKPGPAPAPAPSPRPDPVAVVPVPEPAPDPAPADPEPSGVSADTPATLVVSGNAQAVELQGDYGGFRQGTPLPPGGYAVYADFGSGLVDTGIRTIALPGGRVHASCTAESGQCVVTP